MTPLFFVLLYLVGFGVCLCFKPFRDAYVEWMSFKDPLGIRFWGKFWPFGIYTLLCFGLVAFFA